MRYSIFILIALAFACTDPEREAIILEDLVERGVADFKRKKTMECYQKALLDADGIVDSIFLSKAFFTKQDTFIKPIKPTRPGDPVPWEERDDRDIAPLFDSLGQKTESDSLNM